MSNIHNPGFLFKCRRYFAMFLIIKHFWLTKCKKKKKKTKKKKKKKKKTHRCHQIALRFQTFGPWIHYTGFADHCKLVVKNDEPKLRNPVSRLHENNLQDLFLHEVCVKACPRTSLARLAPAAQIFAPSILNDCSHQYGFPCYPSDTTLEKMCHIFVTALNV